MTEATETDQTPSRRPTHRTRRWRERISKQLFQATVTDNRELHLSILLMFADRDLTDPAPTLEQNLAELPREAPDLELDEERVRRSLDALVEWGHLDESRNESATYRTPEEFQRRNLQWSPCRRCTSSAPPSSSDARSRGPYPASLLLYPSRRGGAS